MKTLNAKRITTLAAGAALLGLGVAFGGSIAFQNVPIISSSGQPLVQVVVGSTAQPIDAVSAGNIAAAIGNLAYASVPVTATVNASQAASVLKVQVTSASYTLANQQVWLNESGTAGSTSGTFQFGALIGSVLNGAIILNSPQNTKTAQTGTSYAYPEKNPTLITDSPADSPFSYSTYVPGSAPSASYNGGGWTGAFQAGSSPTYDNLMEITNAQLPSLTSNYGQYGESSMLWLSGFPLYNQQAQQFQLFSAGGAYQVVFAKPIQMRTGSGSLQINAPIRILGQNWTIINETPSSGATATSSQAYAGGKLFLASSLAPLTTIYVGQNLTSGPFKVTLTDLGQPNSNGVSEASLNVYTNGVLTNTSQVYPGTTAKFNITGQTLFVNVNQTFAGLYAYQKWAKLQLYNNVYPVISGQPFNKTTNDGWTVDLLWTNTTATSSAQNANALDGIIIYNTSGQTDLSSGQSFSFIASPQRYKVTFVGDSFGSGNFDPVSLTTSEGQVTYKNPGTAVGGTQVATQLSEPAQLLTVQSGIPNAFTYAGQSSSSVQYILTPYAVTATGNALSVHASSENTGNVIRTSVILANSLGGGPWISSSYPIAGTVTGLADVSGLPVAGNVTESFSISSGYGAGNVVYLSTPLWNVSSIQLTNGRALPQITVTVADSNTLTANGILSTLTVSGAGDVLYPVSGQTYQGLQAGNVLYNQQNSQPTNSWVLTSKSTIAQTGQNQLWQYTMVEQPVTGTTSTTDNVEVDLYNASVGVSATNLNQFNSTLGTRNATYVSSQGVSLTANPGFRTERGSKVASISGTTDTFDFATSVDQLWIDVGPANSTVAGKSYALHGPYGVGQATNIANVSIGKVAANITVGAGAKYNITGISNIQAVPSVASATTPVLLKNLSGSAPLVVLASTAAAAPQSNYILVGSGFVNTLSQQLQSAYNVTFTPTSAPVFQAYGANRILVAGFYGNQTWQAAQGFINALYSKATV